MGTDGAEGLRFRKDVPKRTQGPRQRKNSSVRACLVNQVNTCRTMMQLVFDALVYGEEDVEFFGFRPLEESLVFQASQ